MRCARWMASRFSMSMAIPTGEVYDASLTAPALNPVQSYDVEEETIALYLNANLQRRPMVR